MLNISKSQEREERRGLGRGMVTSVFGLLFCWVPLLGLLLSGIGYGKIVSRVTVRHRVRRGLYVCMSLVILVLSIGILAFECYHYVQNPNVLRETGMWIYTRITGESQLPGMDEADDPDFGSVVNGVDYDETGASGLGMDTSIYGYEDDDVWGYDEESDVAYHDDYVDDIGG